MSTGFGRGASAAWPSREEWAAGAERWARETFDADRQVPADDPSRRLTADEQRGVEAIVLEVHRALRRALIARLRELAEGSEEHTRVAEARRQLFRAWKARDFDWFVEVTRRHVEQALPAATPPHAAALRRVERILLEQKSRFRAAAERALAEAIAQGTAHRATDEGWAAELERRRVAADFALGFAGLRGMR